MGAIPIRGDHQRAEYIYRSFQIRKKKLAGSNESIAHIYDDAWRSFVSNSPWKSRLFTALSLSTRETTAADRKGEEEEKHEDVDKAYEEMEQIGGLINLKKRQLRRSMEWLAEHGACADNLVPGKSTIPGEQAGNGAFASRFLKEGSVVVPIPLICIPDRSLLDMYPVHFDRRTGEVHEQKPTVVSNDIVIGKQLLLNYCLGHEESTMLLSPYGPMITWVNHNRTLANVRLQWASPARSNHNPQLLNKEVWFLEREEGSKINLAMELIALRDINPGEEVFLDYGRQFEEAWQHHIQTWKPFELADQYESAEDLNRRQDRLKTKRQLELDPYPNNVVLKFNVVFSDPKGWKTALYAGESMDAFKAQYHTEYIPCQVLKYTKSYGGFGFYSAIVYNVDNPLHEGQLIKEAPREAFLFHEVPYTADVFLRNTFRHEIGIPDDIFPDSWKNRRSTRRIESAT